MRFRLCAGAVAAILAAGPWAAAQTPVDPEFRVNTTTLGDQTASRVARDPQGRTNVVWTSGNSPREVYLQRYNPDGSPLGSEVSVSASPLRDDTDPDVATDAAGNFTVVWSHDPGSHGFEIMAQRYSSFGSPQGSSFQVNTSYNGTQYHPSIAMSAEGNFVVVWANEQDGRIDGQVFSPGGVRAGQEFAVSQTIVRQLKPSVSWLPPFSRFAAAWYRDDGTRAVYARVFHAGNQGPVCPEFPVRLSNNDEYVPSTASDAAGNFVVAWHETFPHTIRAHVYNSGCTETSPEHIAYQATGVTPANVRAAMAPEGDFILTWQANPVVGATIDVLAGRFAADGAALGPPFLVNSYSTSEQSIPAIARSGTREFVITWSSFFQDGSFLGVYGQRFGGLRPAGLIVDSAGNGVWDKGETVTVQPAWLNLTATAQTATGTATNLVGPVGPYAILDGLASYGSIAPGAKNDCGNNCYSFNNMLPTLPPSTGHKDATFLETLAPPSDEKKTWTLHVGNSFADVPASNGFYKFAEILLHRGVTNGCGGGNFCPTSGITRQEMAVFLLISKEGASYVPPACTGQPFNDVPVTSGFCRWIAELARRGVVSGCGGGNFCPTGLVNRQEMAVFLLATLDPTLNPPACVTDLFLDVPASSTYCRWIKELVNRGITGGCGGGNYCPTNTVPRQEMAVFLTVTFGLTLYGPF